jgi:hypothetical protein
MICASDDRALDDAIDLYATWRRLGLSHCEMMAAADRPFRADMGGDDVIVELYQAWHTLTRT